VITADVEQVTDIEHMINDGITSMREIGTISKDIAISIEIAEELKRQLTAGLFTYRALLQMTVEELLRNASKYSETKKLTIRLARTESGDLKVDVEDYGVGIAPENLEKLFTPGFTTAEDKKTGTGYGLYALRETIESIGGTIFVKSEPGKGTCFSFMLPVDEYVTMREWLTDEKIVEINAKYGKKRG
jgi:signal transduction histidine kinase